jgi:hypothetical protein
MYWADTGTRGGLSRAFELDFRRIAIFPRPSDNGDDDMLQKAGVHQTLHVWPCPGCAGKAEGLNSAAAQGEEYTRADVHTNRRLSIHQQHPARMYLNNRRIMEGMAKCGRRQYRLGYRDAVAKQEFPSAKFHMVEGYALQSDHRFTADLRCARRTKPVDFRPEH